MLSAEEEILPPFDEGWQAIVENARGQQEEEILPLIDKTVMFISKMEDLLTFK